MGNLFTYDDAKCGGDMMMQNVVVQIKSRCSKCLPSGLLLPFCYHTVSTHHFNVASRLYELYEGVDGGQRQ